MLKPAAIRDVLARCAPQLAQNPERLILTVGDGRIVAITNPTFAPIVTAAYRTAGRNGVWAGAPDMGGLATAPAIVRHVGDSAIVSILSAEALLPAVESGTRVMMTAPSGTIIYATQSLADAGLRTQQSIRNAASPAGDAVESVDVKTIANQRVRIAVRGRRASVALPTSLPPSVSAVGRDEEVDLYPTAEQCSGLQLEPRTPASSRDRCTVRGRTLLCRGER